MALTGTVPCGITLKRQKKNKEEEEKSRQDPFAALTPDAPDSDSSQTGGRDQFERGQKGRTLNYRDEFFVSVKIGVLGLDFNHHFDEAKRKNGG